MSNQLIWQERFNIGVESIDREHKKLFNVLNRILAFDTDDEKNEWVYQEAIKYFKDHALNHFLDEENYMASINYAGLDTHKRLHDDFKTKTLPALENELTKNLYSIDAINHFLGVCVGWLFGHTITEDHAIVGRSKSTWSNFLPNNAHSAMKEAIIQLIYDLFQLNSSIISECYGGEKFGKGIYYRLVYSNKDGKKWETILVFEEKLILNTIGTVMNTRSKKMSSMFMNATRYTARQFVDRINEDFISTNSYELINENLLNYEQFQKIFDKEKPQFSLLLDTGKGYFAYCVTTSHINQIKNIPSIAPENEMIEVSKYLSKNKVKKKKKKILVVDDSDFALKAMENLLSKDYDITLANSGLSAIRCITLNRPNLILLDYDMPICDGSQVLEMIYSEKDFANIPVIFLTGRMDKKSIDKVLLLKPAGYLLKTLQPLEIKKNIDDYFKRKNL